MNNEEKILQMLVQLTEDMSDMKKRMSSMEGRMSSMEGRMSSMEEDIAIIKEDAEVTRAATNTLLEWAEEAQVEVKIPLYKRAQ